MVPISSNPLPLQKWENLQQFLSKRNSPDTKLVGNIYSELESKLELQVKASMF